MKIFGKIVITVSLCIILAVQTRKVTRDFVEGKNKRQMLILNNLMPRSIDYLVETAVAHQAYDPRKLQSYVYYYEKVVAFMPQRADARGMLGYLYYQMGQEQKAIAAYEKAIKVYPHFFWFYYNLGMIHLKAERYEEAVAFFKKASAAKPEAALAFIYSSKRIYLPVVSKMTADLNKPMTEQLKEGYQRGHVLMALIEKYSKLPANLRTPWNKDKLYLQIY